MVLVKYPYVYEDVDRHGNVRVYFRRKGQRKVRVREPLGSAEFDARYRELLTKSKAGQLAPVVDPARGKPIPGTWRWLCVSYMGSATFLALDPQTQSTRRNILESTFEEPLYRGADEVYAAFPLPRMAPKAIKVLRDRKKETPNAANSRIKTIRYVYNWAMNEEPPLVRANPASGIGLLKATSNGHHSWTIEEVEQYEKRHPIGTKARLALALFLYTGFRRSDAARVGRQHASNGWFKLRQFKNRNRHPVDIEVPILPELQRIIDASPTGDMTYLVTDFGLPFSIAGLGNKMREWCDEAGLKHCSAHGLRKAGAALAAENGATELQLMAIFGWKTIQEAERYTRAARRRKLASAATTLLSREERKRTKAERKLPTSG